MGGASFICGLVALASIAAAWHSNGNKAFGFWLLAVFALIGAANS